MASSEMFYVLFMTGTCQRIILYYMSELTFRHMVEMWRLFFCWFEMKPYLCVINSSNL